MAWAAITTSVYLGNLRTFDYDVACSSTPCACNNGSVGAAEHNKCTMKAYFFVSASGQQVGPVAGEMLKEKGVTAQTLVWCEGMANWTKAADVPELKPLFRATPPPMPNPNPRPTPPPMSNPNPSGVCPDNYMVWAILSTICCCFPTGIVAIIKSNKVESLWRAGDYTGAQQAASDAKTWCFISLAGGLLASFLAFVFGFLSAL